MNELKSIYLNIPDCQRPYDPIDDGLVYSKNAWLSELKAFNDAVKLKKYNKISYLDWKTLEFFPCDYRVVWFRLDEKFQPSYAIIQDFYNSDTEEYGLMAERKYEVQEGHALGKYLADRYFYKYFRLKTVDANLYSQKYINWSNKGIGKQILYDYFNPQDKMYTEFNKITDNFNKTTEAINNMSDALKNGWSEYGYARTITQDEAEKAVKDYINSKIETAADSTTTNQKYDTNTSTAIPITHFNVPSTGTTIKIKPDDSVNWITGGTVSINTDSCQEQIDKINEEIDKLKNENAKGKESNMKMFNFDFGPIKDNDAIRMSPYGMAVKNVNGTYQAYDKKNGEMMDVDVFNFKADNMFFKMPVAIDAIEAGDVIIFNRVPCFVFGFSDQGDVIVIDIARGEKKTILPSRSPFNFNYITKVVSLMDNMFGNETPSAENPFGNILPFILMNEDNSSVKDMLPMMMLMNGNTGAMNPMMLYFMMKDGKNDDSLLPLLFMMNSSKK